MLHGECGFHVIYASGAAATKGLSSSSRGSPEVLYKRTLQTMAQMKPRPRSGEVRSWPIPTYTVSFSHSEARKADMIVPMPGAMMLMTRMINEAIYVMLNNAMVS